MNKWFPISRLEERVLAETTMRCWEVIVEPMPPANELEMVLADLCRDGTVDIEYNGRVRHNTQCHTIHELPEQLTGLNLAQQAFLLELIHREPPGFPLVRCLIPELALLPGHPHFYNGGIICPIFPPDGTWEWRKNTASDYLHHVSLWLLKTAVWQATKEKIGQGLWIGSEAGHSLEFLVRTKPDENCPCGSGLKFHQCHMRKFLLSYNEQMKRRQNLEAFNRLVDGCNRHPDGTMGA